MKNLLCIALTCLLLMTCAIGLAVDVNVEDIPSNYALTIDGIPVQLPVPMSAFLDKGWTLSPIMPDDATMPAMTYDLTSLYKGNQNCSMYVVNGTEGELPLKECTVAGFTLFKTDNIPFVMNNGISFTSSSDEVIAAYGLDKQKVISEYAEGTTGFSVSFYPIGDDGMHWDKGISSVSVGMNQIDFDFDKPLTENGTLDTITIQYMTTEKNEVKEEAAEPADGTWTCENGHSGNTKNFCGECGAPKPQEELKACPSCSTAFEEGKVPKFCPNCGAKIHD